MRKLPQDMPIVDGITLRTLNTQVAEQRNALLERVRTQIAYSCHDNVNIYLKYFLGARNMMLRDSLPPTNAAA